MKKVLLVLLIATFGFCEELENEGKKEEPDMSALRKWLTEKRMVAVKEKGGDLSIAGEVRTEMQAIREIKKEQGSDKEVNQRGPNGLKSDYGFDIEVNLMLDYRSDRTWASIKLEFDNDMGQVGGTTNKINLERAYFGGRILNLSTLTLDLEFGRRNLDNIFDSKLEFSSLFDGILLKFSKIFESVGNFYINSGAFVVDEKQHHFGFVSELGLLDIGHTGLYCKYSIIDWKEHRYPDGIKWKNYNYLISQGILGFQHMFSSWGALFKLYSGFLYNHMAKPIVLSDNKKANWGWYIGTSIGQVRKKGDWAVDISYQYLLPQAVPDFDASGAGRGNAAGIGFFTQKINDPNSAALTLVSQPVGACNFKGVVIEVLYAVTNNLTWLNNLTYSKNAMISVGPELSYRKFESELIYAF